MSRSGDSPPEETRTFAREDSAEHLTVHIVTLFPSMFEGWLQQGVVARATQRGLVTVDLVPLRPFGIGKHHVTDDYPFGGGAGMVIKPEPLFAAVESLSPRSDVPVILLSPRGRRFEQREAQRLALLPDLIMIAGHYEGIDERVRSHLATEELSIGDFVLSSGELAAMVVTDAIVRLRPGALSTASAEEESFTDGLLEYPQYTRPATYRGWDAPDILLSGHHAEVNRWRRWEAVRETQRVRPDLIASAKLSAEERTRLEELGRVRNEVLDNR